jgi:hypothetical protein
MLPSSTLYRKSDSPNYLVTRSIDRKEISNEPIEKNTSGPNKIVDRRLARALRAVSSEGCNSACVSRAALPASTGPEMSCYGFPSSSSEAVVGFCMLEIREVRAG